MSPREPWSRHCSPNSQIISTLFERQLWSPQVMVEPAPATQGLVPAGHQVGWVLTCLESGPGGVGRALCHLRELQGTRVGRQRGAGEGEHSRGSGGRRRPCQRLQPRGCPTPHRTPTPSRPLLEELAKVRSQPDCLSFSEDVGSWEEALSVFLMEAGGSEETCE